MQPKLVTLLVVLTASSANSQTADNKPRFEVASLKLADKNLVPGLTGRTKGGPGSTDPGRVTLTQVDLLQLLRQAWGVESEAYRLVVPELVKVKPRDADRFDITATMSPDTT